MIPGVPVFYCSNCWAEIHGPLERLGSLLCQDCRDGVAAGDRSPLLRAERHVEQPSQPVAHENAPRRAAA